MSEKTIIATGDDAQALAAGILGDSFVKAMPVSRIERHVSPESEQVYGDLLVGDKLVFEFAEQPKEFSQFVVVENGNDDQTSQP